MYRILLAATLGIGLAAAVPQVQAQSQGTRSYAPENLRTLSVPDRIRVLETEYREQSNGRRLPNDQRDFYLTQINSGWSFSRIKQDMSRSLGGGGDWNPGNPGNGNGNGRTFRCESVDERYRECRVNSRNRVVLTRQISKANCQEGRTWGQRQGVVWVNWGCRGEFAESGSGWGGGQDSAYNVTCSSLSEAYRTCSWNNRYGRPVLIETLSDAPCVEGRSWGHRGNAIWVDRGCRGRFAPSR